MPEKPRISDIQIHVMESMANGYIIKWPGIHHPSANGIVKLNTEQVGTIRGQTLQSLYRQGMIRQSRSDLTTYILTAKGRQHLKDREAKDGQ